MRIEPPVLEIPVSAKAVRQEEKRRAPQQQALFDPPVHDTGSGALPSLSLLAPPPAVQETGNAELIAAVLNYGNSAVSGQDKEKVRKKKDQRETSVTNFIFDAEKLETLKGKTFMVTGSLKTFVSRDELKECLTTCGAVLTETLGEDVDYLITNTPDSGTAKNKKAVELGVARITEAQFNDMTGRKAAG